MISSKGIIFSAPEVNAILEGRKTVTRRIIKPQPPADWVMPEEGIAYRGETVGYCGRQRVLVMGHNGQSDVDVELIHFPVQRCPYGKPGDLLFVKEKLVAKDGYMVYAADEVRIDCGDLYWPACIEKRKVIPSIHMPLWASRITLQIVDVSVERVRDITRSDCMAEGCPVSDFANETYPRQWFANWWESIHGRGDWERNDGAWERNDWVWRIEFKKL